MPKEKAIFAQGCFWGVEERFRKVEGVKSTRVGYTGGHIPNPIYSEVCKGTTGHAEAVEITFDPQKVSYTDLLALFWSSHDPTTPNRQGPDVGSQYRSAIFYTDDSQKEQALESKANLEKSGIFSAPIVTEISPAGTFWPAEEYHQKYILKTGRRGCRL